MAAVREVSLSIRSGEILTLLGPSGCGKTTCLLIIAGLLRQDAGDVLISGELVNPVPAYQRNIGMVFQSYALFPHMTVGENVAFGLKMRRIPGRDSARMVKDAISLVRLEGLEGRYPRQLSGGQQQRVALARALAFRPALLLLDEPLSNLDAKLRQEMRAELSAICRQVGITTVLVTHDQQEALEVSDRIAVMRDGIVIQLGSPADIYERPGESFVATFIGDSNMFEARVREIDGDTVLLETSEGLGLRAASAPVRLGEKVTALVRPHRLSIGDTQRNSNNRFAATVRATTYAGDRLNVLMDVAGKMVRASLPTSGEGTSIRVGQQVIVSWLPTHTVIIQKAHE